jgi:hypothetical protein
MKKIKNSLAFFVELLKYNTLTRLIVSVLLSAISLKLSEYYDFMTYPAVIFIIYPIWIFIWMFMYAWILNPIRDRFPNSRFTKKVITFLDNHIK